MEEISDFFDFVKIEGCEDKEWETLPSSGYIIEGGLEEHWH